MRLSSAPHRVSLSSTRRLGQRSFTVPRGNPFIRVPNSNGRTIEAAKPFRRYSRRALRSPGAVDVAGLEPGQTAMDLGALHRRDGGVLGCTSRRRSDLPSTTAPSVAGTGSARAVPRVLRVDARYDRLRQRAY